jgi:competence protein ComEC
VQFFAGFLIAILSGYFVASLLFFVILFMASLLVLLIYRYFFRFQANSTELIKFCTGLCLGFAVISIFVLKFQLQKFPETLWQKKIPVTFTVVSAPQYESYRTSFLADVAELKRRVRLSWYVPPRDIAIGDSWQATIKLKPIHGYANPGNYDYERHNMLRGISAQGYVDNKATYERIGKQESQGSHANLREKIKSSMLHNDSPSTVGYLLALAIGDRELLTDTDWSVLQSTGTAHLVAISGLHVGLVFAIFYFLSHAMAKLLNVRFPGLARQQVCSMLALIFSASYVLLSGMAISTLRAYFMLIIVCLFLCVNRRVQLSYSLLVTACLFLLVQPMAAMQVGFILSFGTVALIATLTSGGIIATKRVLAALVLQWRLSLALVPLTLLALGNIAVVSPLANSIAIPWVSFLLVPGLLLYNTLVLLHLPYAEPLLQFLHYAMHMLVVFLQQLSSIAIMPQLNINSWTQYLALTMMLLVPKILLPIFLLAVFFPSIPVPKAGELWLTVLDVGQGLASVVRTKNHVLVYDTGPLQGRTVLIPYLRAKQINTVDIAMISHADADHKNGLQDLISDLEVKQIYLGETMPELVGFSYCEQGQVWEWDGVIFEVLHPGSEQSWRGNNLSCVLRITANNKTILLSGDIQKPVEDYLLRNFNEKLKADLIVLPHHGSKTSSSKNFVNAVQAEVGIVPSGFLSQYGHPHNDVVANYEAVATRLYYTAHQGAIHVKINEKGISTHTYRARYRRWWQ